MRNINLIVRGMRTSVVDAMTGM